MQPYRFAAASAFAALAVLALSRSTAAGDQVPFQGNLTGEFTAAPIPDTPISLVVARGTGEATQLGHLRFDFPLSVNVVTQTGGGIYTFTAANGDTVLADVMAESMVLPSGLRHVMEMGIIFDGTGRFAGASGSFMCERLLDRSTGEVTGYFDGTISSLGAGKH